MHGTIHSFSEAQRRPRPRRRTGHVDITVRLDAARRANAVSRGLRGNSVPLGHAVDLGLMSEEGYLTPLGYAFWRRPG